MSLPVSQLGWLAGILDMKGMVLRKANRSRATPQIVLAVESKQISVVRELSRMTGTQPELQAPREMKPWMRRGCTDHCPDKHIHGPEDPTMPATARWTVTGAALVVVLYNAMPYIRNDGRGFSEAMREALAGVVLVGQGRGAIERSLARLGELGWDIPDAVKSPVRGELVEVAGG